LDLLIRASSAREARFSLPTCGVYHPQIVYECLLEAVIRGELPPKAKTMEMASFILNSYEGALLRAKADRSEAPLRLVLQMIFGSFLILG
jgi:TetR/AcrR family transcriptional repressor of nem operon